MSRYKMVGIYAITVVLCLLIYALMPSEPKAATTVGPKLVEVEAIYDWRIRQEVADMQVKQPDSFNNQAPYNMHIAKYEKWAEAQPDSHKAKK